MTLEEMILRNDTSSRYCEHDVLKHLRNGVMYYENYEDFEESQLETGCDPEDIPELWEKLDRSTVDGIEYRYEVVL